MEIAVFITGGTIGMRKKQQGAGVAPCCGLHELFDGELPVDDTMIRVVEFSDKPSPHMTPEDMLRLSAAVDAALAEETVHGAVVLHGTDLLAETSFFLDTALTSPKPVVTTGSMRHMEEMGYDGKRNLLNSIYVCQSLPRSSEVVLQMADNLFTARDAVKLDSLAVDPFTGAQRGKVGRVINGGLKLTQDISCVRPRFGFKVNGCRAAVPFFGCYPGMGAEFLRHALTNAEGRFAADAVVLEGFGAGNVPPAIMPVVLELLAQGVPVIITTRCAMGGVYPIYGYDGGAAQLMEAGAILGGALSSPKARLLALAALGSGLPGGRLAEVFGCFSL